MAPHREASRDPLKRLISRLKSKTLINENGCHEWQGKISSKNKYGRTKYLGKIQYAHRLSWIVANGNIPKDLYVLHKCDNPKCINVDHLFLGTADDNHIDAVSKGRKKQTPKEDIYLFKALRILGCTWRQISRKTGYPDKTVRGNHASC